MSAAADLLERSAKDQPSTPVASKRSAVDLLEASAEGEPTQALTGHRDTDKPSLVGLVGRDEMPAESAQKAGDLAVGVAENVIPALQSVYAEPAAWLAKQGTIAGNQFGLTDGSPEGVQNAVRRFLMSSPQTPMGQTIEGGMASVLRPVAESTQFYGNLLDKVPVVGPGLRNAAEGVLAMAPGAAMVREARAPLAAVERGVMEAPENAATPGPVGKQAPPSPLTAIGTPRGPYSNIPESIAKTESGTPIPSAPSTLTATGHPRAAFWEPSSEKAKIVDSEPVSGGLPKEYGTDRAQILDRIGLETARESSLTGDAQRAATDWQMKKFDEPAGKAAFDQFESERQALNKFSGKIIDETKGSRGLDEDSLNSRGQSIAAPFDDLRDWFKDQRGQLYEKADERSGGHPVVQPLSLEEMLNDRSFNNQMTARGQTHMVNGIRSELERFKESNGGSLTVKEAEQFRQFLNTIWTPDNSSVIGRLKGALDEDVLKGAGEDLYGPARQMAQMEKQTLDNPNGISKLFDVDPKNPINRTTALDKIPDTLNRLSPEQFSNVIKTLQTMPESLQPQAQAAINEIKAHLANKIFEAGSKTQGQWNATGVSDVLKKNAAKLKIAFEDQPEVLAMLQDLDSAGRILKVDGSYPGAAAQASNAMKRGFMSHAVSKVASGTGALIGSSMGPVGAMAGAAGGEYLGGKIGGSMAEARALGNWEKGAVQLKDLLQGYKK